MIFEYFEDVDNVLPVIDMGDHGPMPTEADHREAARLDAARRAGDPRLQLAPRNPVSRSARVVWIG